MNYSFKRNMEVDIYRKVLTNVGEFYLNTFDYNFQRTTTCYLVFLAVLDSWSMFLMSSRTWRHENSPFSFQRGNSE